MNHLQSFNSQFSWRDRTAPVRIIFDGDQDLNHLWFSKRVLGSIISITIKSPIPLLACVASGTCIPQLFHRFSSPPKLHRELSLRPTYQGIGDNSPYRRKQLKKVVSCSFSLICVTNDKICQWKKKHRKMLVYLKCCGQNLHQNGQSRAYLEQGEHTPLISTTDHTTGYWLSHLVHPVTYPSTKDLIDGCTLFQRAFCYNFCSHFLHIQHKCIKRFLYVWLLFLLLFFGVLMFSVWLRQTRQKFHSENPFGSL